MGKEYYPEEDKKVKICICRSLFFQLTKNDIKQNISCVQRFL